MTYVDFNAFGYQLPSEREGYVGPSSTEFQALREAQAAFGELRPTVSSRYVKRLLERRSAEEAVRASKREQREARWREIREGRRSPRSVTEVCVEWYDRAGSAGPRSPAAVAAWLRKQAKAAA